MKKIFSSPVWRYAKSLRLRLFLILFLVGLISSMTIKYAILANYETRAVEIRRAELQAQTTAYAERLRAYDFLREPASNELENELQLLAAQYEGRVRIVNAAALVVADTDGASTGQTFDLSGDDAWFVDAQPDEMRYDRDAGVLEIATPLDDGVLLVDASTNAIRQMAEILTTKANRIQLIVILTAAFFAIFASELLVKPLDRITRAINEVKAGYTDEPISAPEYLETERITGAFNQLQARMKALDDSRQEFVSNVSHELKTPITSMKVLADTLLAEENAPPEMYRDFLTDISEEIDREDQIINDLLALVKMDKEASPLKVATVDINGMTEIVLKRLRPIARQRNIDVTLESAREITAEIDEVKISMVIMNLVENAIKYNTDGGWVRVELDADPQFFTIKVSDSGAGIPEESLEQIFDRFYRVDKSRAREVGGTGLGLSVARQATLMHRGEITAQSAEGVGSVFTVKLPLIHVPPESMPKARKRTGFFTRKE